MSRQHERLTEAGNRYKAARAELDVARAALMPEVLTALHDHDRTQHAIAKASGLTRERIRVIADKAGIERPSNHPQKGQRKRGAESDAEPRTTAPKGHDTREARSEPPRAAQIDEGDYGREKWIDPA